MNCPDELTLSILADGELPANETRLVSEHLRSCVSCKTIASQLELEIETIVACLDEPAPRAKSWSWRLNLMVACVVLSPFSWAIAGAWVPRLPAQFAWLLRWGTASAVLSMTRLWTSFSSSEVLSSVIGSFAISASIVGVLALLAYRERSFFGVRVATALLSLLVLVPEEARAAEMRHAESATIEIGPSEEIDETAFLSAKKVLLAGRVRGDVFVVAENVEISGRIEGNLFSLAESTEITGVVAGEVFALGQDVELRGRVEGAIHAAGENVFLSEESRVSRSGYLAGESVRLRGVIDRELFFAGARVTIMGKVRSSVTGWGHRVSITDGAVVDGDVKLVVPDADVVTIDESCKVSGVVDVDVHEHEEESSSATWLLGAIVRTLSLLLMAFAIHALFPSFVPRSPATSRGVLRAMGVGFLALIATPLAVLFLALTVIGIPLSLVLLVGYLLVWFCAPLVVAWFALQLLPEPRRFPASLRLGFGLFVLLSILQLPIVGWGLSFLVLLLGSGGMLLHLHRLHAGTAESAGGEPAHIS